MEKTLKNLTKAFIGESQARNRYNFYAKTAKKEWYEQVAEIFEITAENEREHAKWLLRMIQELKWNQTNINVKADSDLTLGNTIENLNSSINGENYEHSSMYPEFATVAEEEWLTHIAERLKSIGKAEIHHEERFQKLLKEIKEKSIFEKKTEKKWFCRKCWYTHKWTTPPEKCPSCDHPYNYFQIQCEEY